METNYNGMDYDKLRTNIEMLANARGLFPWMWPLCSA